MKPAPGDTGGVCTVTPPPVQLGVVAGRGKQNTPAQHRQPRQQGCAKSRSLRQVGHILLAGVDIVVEDVMAYLRALTTLPGGDELEGGFCILYSHTLCSLLVTFFRTCLHGRF
jgi:hypothetical protein